MGHHKVPIERAAALVGWHKVEIDGAAIRFREPGMALTLNGIAQGYITDRIGDLLRERGFRHVLVDMGEQLAIGPKWDGEAWRVGIANPAEPGKALLELPVSSGAIATSGGYGYHFDRAGRIAHILDPGTGAAARRCASVTVLAERAATADGLSTALIVVPAERARALLSGGARAFLIPEGSKSGHWL